MLENCSFPTSSFDNSEKEGDIFRLMTGLWHNTMVFAPSPPLGVVAVWYCMSPGLEIPSWILFSQSVPFILLHFFGSNVTKMQTSVQTYNIPLMPWSQKQTGLRCGEQGLLCGVIWVGLSQLPATSRLTWKSWGKPGVFKWTQVPVHLWNTVNYLTPSHKWEATLPAEKLAVL